MTRLTNIAREKGSRDLHIIDVMCEFQNENSSTYRKRCDKVEIACVAPRGKGVR